MCRHPSAAGPTSPASQQCPCTSNLTSQCSPTKCSQVHAHLGRCTARAGRQQLPRYGSAAQPQPCGLQQLASEGVQHSEGATSCGRHATCHIAAYISLLFARACRAAAAVHEPHREESSHLVAAHLGSTREGPARTTAPHPGQAVRRSRRPHGATTCSRWRKVTSAGGSEVVQAKVRTQRQQRSELAVLGSPANCCTRSRPLAALRLPGCHSSHLHLT